MKELTIKYSNGDKEKKIIPEKWEDLTLGKVCDIVERVEDIKKDPTVMLSLLLDVDHSEILDMTSLEVAKLSRVVISDGMTRFPSFAPRYYPALNISGRTIKVPKTINKISYGGELYLQAKANESSNMREVIPAILAVLLYAPISNNSSWSDEVADLICEEMLKAQGLTAFKLGTFFFEPIQTNRENWGKRLRSKRKHIDLKAGVDQLDKFAQINPLYALTGGDLLKADQWLSTPYNDVMTVLWFMKTKAEIEAKKIELIREK